MSKYIRATVSISSFTEVYLKVPDDYPFNLRSSEAIKNAVNKTCFYSDFEIEFPVSYKGDIDVTEMREVTEEECKEFDYWDEEEKKEIKWKKPIDKSVNS